MNKGFKSLRRLSRILKIPPERPKTLPKRIGKIPRDHFLQTLSQHLNTFEAGMEVLETSLPLQEGKSQLDLLASNPSGEMILIWVFERLSSEDLFPLLAPYDWFRRNEKLWDHLFPQVKKGEGLSFKVWLIAREVDPEIKSVLPYLKEITLQVFHYRWLKKKEGALLVIRPWGVLKRKEGNNSRSKEPLPPRGQFQKPSFPPKAVSPLPALPPITPEEVKDLMGDLSGEEADFEDEITDPFIDLDALKAY